MRESSLAGRVLFSLIVQLTLGRRWCSVSSDDPTDCAYFLIKIVHQITAEERGKGVFDVLAELLLHWERGKANPGRA